MDIGGIISKRRKEQRITQKRLAELLDISHNHLSMVENGKRGISNKLLDELKKILSFNSEELDILEESISKSLYSKRSAQFLKDKEKELEEKELLLINTYDFIRENQFELSKKAAINRTLIDYFTTTEKLVTELELQLVTEKIDFISSIQPVLKTTCKKIERNLNVLKNLSKEAIEVKEELTTGGENMSNGSLEKILSMLPKEQIMGILSEEEKRAAILTYIAKNLKIHWKNYNVKGCATGFSLRLWEGGRGSDPAKRGFMVNRVTTNIELQLDGAETNEESEALIRNLVTNIIEHAMIIVEDALKAARNAKTASVRKKYLDSMNNGAFLLAALQISVILYATELKNRGIDINHEYLSVRIDGAKDRKKELSKVWVEFSESDQEEIDYQRAIEKTNEILDAFEKSKVVSEDQFDKIVEEKMLLKAVGEETIERYIYRMMDDMSQAVLGKIRLISPADL